jgi:hypothetical protein
LSHSLSDATLDLRNIEGTYKTIEMARLIRKVPGITDAEIDDLSHASMIVQTLRRAGVRQPTPSCVQRPLSSEHEPLPELPAVASPYTP